MNLTTIISLPSFQNLLRLKFIVAKVQHGLPSMITLIYSFVGQGYFPFFNAISDNENSFENSDNEFEISESGSFEFSD